MNSAKLFRIGILLFAVGAIGWLLTWRVGRQFRLPPPSAPSTVVETEEGTEIMVTDETKHSIPLDEILGGGPPKDGIPAIDNPKFVFSAEANEFLKDDDIGLGFSWKGVHRFYPYQILVWHEIANDTVAGDPILITYCPLCLTGIVFERRFDSTVTTFGTSGKLWRSNLLMYNRAPDESQESLWSQVLGEAVVGPHTGTKLKMVSADTVRWGQWKALHFDTQVLSRDTGHFRAYGSDPYGDYYTSQQVGFGADFTDTRLHPKTWIVGLEINEAWKAYPHDKVLAAGSLEDEVGGVKIRFSGDSAHGIIRAYRIDTGAEQEIPLVWSFWFSWLNAHPDSLLHE